MVATQASCPSCGTFLSVTHQSTVSLVCKRCHAVLEYRNGSLRQVGNSAVVVPTRASVTVGEEGQYSGTIFQITGHVQLSNEDGATWDEFYLGFSDGQCGWLAQAQGRLILSFRAPLPEGMLLPSFEDISLTTSLPLMPGLPSLSVVEKGQARVEAANGQMPYLLRPGETYPYVDFAAMNGAFAALDYSGDPPDLFVGREVSFDDLGLRPRPSEPTAQTGSASPMVCTECGAQLQIRSPGKTERVTCLQCRALFDISSGRPSQVGSQEESPVKPVVPVGSKAQFGATEYTLAGFIQKATTDELGVTYTWQEYLLADDQANYRWLVQDTEGHWSLFEPITGGSEVQPVIHYGGKPYRFYQHGEARVVYLEGEFYWNVTTGQTSYTADFVHPPYMLSAEFSSADSTKGETNWTHGVYVPIADVRKALGTSEIPSPSGVSPNQPFPHSAIFPIWGLSCLAIIALFMLFTVTASPTKVYEEEFTAETPKDEEERKKAEVQVDRPSGGKKTIQHLILKGSKPMKLEGFKTIRVSAEAPGVKNTFLYLRGSLINDGTLVVQPFDIDVEYYSGVTDNEAWTEDKRKDSSYLSSVPAGDYELRLDVFREPPGAMGEFVPGAQQVPAPEQTRFKVIIEQGAPPRWRWMFIALVAVSIIPLIVWLMSKSFESRRWANSNVTPSGA